jgi:hypothetical protein
MATFTVLMFYILRLKSVAKLQGLILTKAYFLNMRLSSSVIAVEFILSEAEEDSLLRQIFTGGLHCYFQ